MENTTKDYAITNGYKLISNLDKLDMIAGISGTFNRSTYTIGSSTKFFTISPNIDVSYLFPGDIRLQTDFTYNKLTGRGEDYNTSYSLMNAYISRQFGRFNFKASVNDLLNQNTGISRTVTNNAIIDQNFNVLKRYYMFSVTFSLRSIAGLGAGQGQRQNGSGGGGPGGVRMGGGPGF